MSGSELRVFAWISFHADAPGTHRQARCIVAAKSGAAAARAVGATPRQLDNFGETGNERELAQARNEPGVVFWRGINDFSGPFQRWHPADPSGGTTKTATE